MKKALLFVCFNAILINAAQAQFSQKLVSIISDDELEATYFDYAEDQTLSRLLFRTDLPDGINFYNLFAYDSQKHIISDETYQDRGYSDNLDEWSLVTKCTYEYYDNGLLKWRDNFNSWGGSALEQSARIIYEYDADGRLLKESQYWAHNLNSPFMIIGYVYNEQGLLTTKTETMEDFFNPGYFDTTGRVDYTYDADGHLLRTAYYYVSYGQDYFAEADEFAYDEAGNVIKDDVVTESGNVMNRSVYLYDEAVSNDDLLLPRTIEYQIPNIDGNPSQRVAEEYWTRNDNDGELTLITTYIYNYEPMATVGLGQLPQPTFAAYYDAQSAMLCITGNGDARVRVKGTNGQTLFTTTAKQGRADLSSLEAGVYVVSVSRPGQQSAHQKIVVR